jgi:hypothetical protein
MSSLALEVVFESGVFENRQGKTANPKSGLVEKL